MLYLKAASTFNKMKLGEIVCFKLSKEANEGLVETEYVLKIKGARKIDTYDKHSHFEIVVIK